jgi:DNA-binding MarR family transcriptional regulator
MIVTLSWTILMPTSINASGYDRPEMDTAHGPGSIVLLTRLARTVYRRSTEELLGMRLKDFGALCYLRDRGPTSQQELHDVLHMDANNVVLLLNGLEASGWVERKRDPTDRRRHIVELTDKGSAAIERGERGQESIEDEVLKGLTARQRDELRHLLRRALEA